MTVSEPRSPNQNGLPYGVKSYEAGYLILLAAAFYGTSDRFVYATWPIWVFSAAVVAAIPILILRCRDEWRIMPNKGFFLALLVAWVALFLFLGNAVFAPGDKASLPAWMFSQYASPSLDEGHGLIIPFVVLALYWWKRKELVAGPLGLWWPAVGLVALALILHFVGFLSQQQRLSIIGFFLGIYGLTGMAWGRHWLKASFFPFFLLAFCVPVSEFSGTLTLPLRTLVSRLVEIVAHLGLAPDLVRQGTQLFDSEHTFAYEVAAACSGIRSLVALLALTTIYGFIHFKEPWKRITMMLIAIPFAIVGNVARICFTVTVAEMFGQAAGKFVETDFGFITFLVAAGGSFWVAGRLDKIGGAPPGADRSEEQPLPHKTLTDKPATP